MKALRLLLRRTKTLSLAGRELALPGVPRELHDRLVAVRTDKGESEYCAYLHGDGKPAVGDTVVAFTASGVIHEGCYCGTRTYGHFWRTRIPRIVPVVSIHGKEYRLPTTTTVHRVLWHTDDTLGRAKIRREPRCPACDSPTVRVRYTLGTAICDLCRCVWKPGTRSLP